MVTKRQTVTDYSVTETVIYNTFLVLVTFFTEVGSPWARQTNVSAEINDDVFRRRIPLADVYAFQRLCTFQPPTFKTGIRNNSFPCSCVSNENILTENGFLLQN